VGAWWCDGDWCIPLKASYPELGMSPATAYRLLRRGAYPIPARKIGGRWWVSKAGQRDFTLPFSAFRHPQASTEVRAPIR
jgi:hypothetical protein